ncbi:MAG TPA: tripartite tricarboxylate transporter substrate binding protein [Burkholderiales bacterium]|nr:tripartite tricarboxylate transporter substrate binding protein [Burkholderiales bacterium]
MAAAYRGFFFLLCVFTFSAACAQPYPVKPVRLVVTYTAGGPADIAARALAQKLAEMWGQQVVVDNRAGAGGIIGTELVAKAAPDGYTLLHGTAAGLIINPLLVKKLPYDTFRDFAPVSMVVIVPQLLVTHPALPATTLKELIALAKARPGALNYASVGIGSPNHLGMELLKSMAGIDMVHVPYKGATPAMADLIAGQVQLAFNGMASVLPQIASGKMKAIAIGSARRSPAAPDVPTVAEAGLPGFEYVAWNGNFAPAGTPAALVNRLSADIRKALAAPDVVQRLASLGSEPGGNTPAEFAAYVKADHARWARVVQAVGLKAE